MNSIKNKLQLFYLTLFLQISGCYDIYTHKKKGKQTSCTLRKQISINTTMPDKIRKLWKSANSEFHHISGRR